MSRARQPTGPGGDGDSGATRTDAARSLDLAVASGEHTGRVIDDLLALPPRTSDLVERAVAYIQRHHDAADLSLSEIAEAVGVNKTYLCDIFHRDLQISPWTYLNRYRIARARELLTSTSLSVAAISSRVGFNDSSYFGRVFGRQTGMSPRAYRLRASRLP